MKALARADVLPIPGKLPASLYFAEPISIDATAQYRTGTLFPHRGHDQSRSDEARSLARRHRRVGGEGHCWRALSLCCVVCRRRSGFGRDGRRVPRARSQVRTATVGVRNSSTSRYLRERSRRRDGGSFWRRSIRRPPRDGLFTVPHTGPPPTASARRTLLPRREQHRIGLPTVRQREARRRQPQTVPRHRRPLGRALRVV